VLKTLVILRRIKFSRALQDIPEVAAMHHEKLDGGGYPFGYRGSEIPLEARVLAVADVFQALTQTRPYKSGLPAEEAQRRCSEMSRPHTDRYGRESGAHLDPNVVRALGRIIERTGGGNEFFEQESGWEAVSSGRPM
jgi:HD-GYP domain-containing protein (c-di-GMP phosphodiesterase class II)